MWECGGELRVCVRVGLDVGLGMGFRVNVCMYRTKFTVAPRGCYTAKDERADLGPHLQSHRRKF